MHTMGYNAAIAAITSKHYKDCGRACGLLRVIFELYCSLISKGMHTMAVPDSLY